MDRYVGVDAHAASCTLAVVGASGRRLRSIVVETNGRALVEAVKGIGGRLHICLEEGTQSAWLYELLEPHAVEIVVTVAPETKGPKRATSGTRGRGRRSSGRERFAAGYTRHRRTSRPCTVRCARR